MASDRLSLFSQVVLNLYALAQSQAAQSFQDAALACIKALIPFDSSMWGSATMSPQGIEIHTLHLHNTTMQMIEAYQKVKHLDHFAHEVATREKHTISFNANDAHPEQFRDFLLTQRHMHGLITQCLNPQTQFVQWLSLFRNDADRVCSQEEVQFLDALFQHLLQALAINRRLHMQQWVGDASRERWSVAIADQHGFLYHADPEFLRLVSQEHPMHKPDQLPAAVMAAVSSSTPTQVWQHAVLVCTREKDLLYLKVRPKVPADHLSAHEFHIAQMIASGMSIKEVADKINRSQETIRTYSKAIYKKLGTSKATQLSALLMERE